MRFSLLLLFLGPSLLAACSSSAPRPSVDFGPVVDAFGVEGPALDLIDGLPAAFLVGDANQVASVLETRASLPVGVTPIHTLIQCSALNDLSFTDLADQVLEAALEDDGSILLDRVGITATSLRQGGHGLMLVEVDDEGSIRSTRKL